VRITYDELDFSTNIEYPPLESLYGKNNKQITQILSSYFFVKKNLPANFVTCQYTLPLYINFDFEGSSVGFNKFVIGKLLGKNKKELFHYFKA
jgi:hypothetical protein